MREGGERGKGVGVGGQEEGDRERKRGIQKLSCGVHSQGQYLQMELLRTSRDNDSGKMQQLMKMFAVSRVAWAEICGQGGQGRQGKNGFSIYMYLVIGMSL